MEESRDRLAEQNLYRLELRARQAQKKTSGFVKFMTAVYGRTANYGASMGQPLLSVVYAAVLFTLVFAVWHIGREVEETVPESLYGALKFSVENILRPFHVWSISEDRGSDFERALMFGVKNSGANGLWVALLASVQSFFGIIMLFLTGLSARRYFQIN
ncbi:MAG: hypothetical protein AAF788_02555 [Pseudomonadota bacterium]